jgi:hypothetical protein
MRALILALVVTAMLGAAPAALAARPCQDRAGDPVRCDTPSAMPRGWTLQGQRLMDLHAPEPPEPSPAALIGLASVIGGLFVLILLMPKFEDWDEQEGDDKERG